MDTDIIESFSWDIISENIAVKHCDKSFFEYHETGIPIQTKGFWGINDLANGQSRLFELVFADRIFKARFTITKSGKAKMFWYADLENLLSGYNTPNNYPLAKYERLADGKYRLFIIGEQDEESLASSLSTEFLAEMAKLREETDVKTVTVTTTQKHRDRYIAEYAKRIANGICQLCGEKAPFLDSKGSPYLESHHIVWLADGGADSIDNTVALCPNCHRKMHVVKDAADVEYLKNKFKSTGAK